MAALTPAGRVLARRLLAWDRARVAIHTAKGYDTSVYVARQDLAEICITADLDSWPTEVRDLFMTVLEVTRIPPVAKEHMIGPLAIVVPRLSLIERIAYRALATELGVIARLRETSPRAWSDDDGEGD
jgi:hypothetical protein